jgi:hypothetical protein
MGFGQFFTRKPQFNRGMFFRSGPDGGVNRLFGVVEGAPVLARRRTPGSAQK